MNILKDENLSESDETEAEDEDAALIKSTSSTGKQSMNWEDWNLMQGFKSVTKVRMHITLILILICMIPILFLRQRW